MATDQDLRCVISDLIDQVRERDAEIERLRARLEVDNEHKWDGIASRNVTIKAQDREIERLRAELSESMAHESWRPADTLPTEWGSYLVWSEKDGMETLWFQLKDGGHDGRKAGNWYSLDEDEDDWPMNHRVTHWMPLPSVPKHKE